MIYTISKPTWTLSLSSSDNGIGIDTGRFGDIDIISSPLFRITLEKRPGETMYFDSSAGWESVRINHTDGLIRIWLSELINGDEKYDVTAAVTGTADDTGISWTADIINDDERCSVSSVTYPLPSVSGEVLDLFTPERSGRVIGNAGKNGYSGVFDYPGHIGSMQYFAFWGESGGIYLGIHDPAPCMKTFTVTASEGQGRIEAIFPAVGAGTVANSFSLGGCARWQVMRGNWYDAAMIYKDFVVKRASWLPMKGRPDTPGKFKDIAFWICDYIPNSEAQRDARPMTLAAVSERYGKEYWIDAPIKLKEALGVPVGYQVYNWHEIPFNINYPHFLPAREEFVQGIKKLKEAGLYVFPYINAVSWEMEDADEGFETNFANTGHKGAVILPDGSRFFVPYPQKKADGSQTKLAPICPSFGGWRRIIRDVARGIEAELPVDGIYFDQIGAVAPLPCRNPMHSHLPGGGSYWSDGYNRMMAEINADKPDDSFYYTESNGEAYMRSFDGFLTWVWTCGDGVPAFPAVYSGYVQMLGRYTDGATRDDDMYFRFNIAQGLLYGQQLGWLNADVVYKDKRMQFLRQAADIRYRYSPIFQGTLLRPPKVTCSLPPVTSSGITMDQVSAGVWQDAEKKRTVFIAANISDEPASASFGLYPAEYGLSCPAKMDIEMAPCSFKVFELK